MGSQTHRSLGLFALVSGAIVFMAFNSKPQTLSNLYSFQSLSDGATIYAGVTLSGKTLYGATVNGYGDEGGDTIYAINTDGSDFRVVLTDAYVEFYGGVIVSSNILYGTSTGGGNSGYGMVFAVCTNGSGLGFTNLHNFSPFAPQTNTNSDGAYPYGNLILWNNTLYGTTSQGGAAGVGVLFAINTDGLGFTNLHSFNGRDGSYPRAALIALGDILYGTTEEGGSNGLGTVFAMNTDGTGFTNLYSFSSASGAPYYTNSDGASPRCTLIFSGNRLYGTAYEGGAGGNGTVFAINIDGTGFTNLHSFAGPFHWPPFGTTINLDGALPYGALVVSGNSLYGTTTEGGYAGAGTIFCLRTDGTGFTNLYISSGGTAPNYFEAGLTLSGNALYGTSVNGGTYEYGTVFSITFSPTLAITASGTNVILTWPTNVAGFDYTGYTLQSTTNLASPSWSAVSPSPVIVNGQETVTNPISATQMFYRLLQ